MSYYDGWKTATPWDDEVALTVSFECGECHTDNDDVDAIGSAGGGEVIVNCFECDTENNVDVGGE